MDFQSEAHADVTSEIKYWVIGDEEPKPIQNHLEEKVKIIKC